MISRWSFIYCFALVWLLVTGNHIQAADKPPHIILILADDLGWSDLACYGSDLHETPNLDGLTARGLRFTQAYASSPVCSPTRASILTGRHPARLQMTIWRENAHIRGNRTLLEPVTKDALPLEEITLAEQLKELGYYTAHVGKWHLGTAEYYPQPHGFDVNVGGTLWGAPQSFFYPFSGTRYFQGWRYVPDLEPSEPGDYLTDRLTDKAIEILDQKADKQPVFLNLWYHSVHTPIDGKPELVEKYRQKIAATHPENHTNPDYAAMVESLDQNVGRVLNHLDKLGIRDQSLVLFLSDNGGFVNECKLHKGHPVTSNAPLRSGKGACYEGGVRIPLLVDLPGNDRHGDMDTPVTTCDLFPTLMQLVGKPLPQDLTLDGVDLAPLWNAPHMPWQRESLFFHYPHYYPTTTPVSAIRSGDWKLLHYYEDDHLELFRLDQDPSESNNLVAVHPGKAADLFESLKTWRQSVSAQAPEPNP